MLVTIPCTREPCSAGGSLHVHAHELCGARPRAPRRGPAVVRLFPSRTCWQQDTTAEAPSTRVAFLPLLWARPPHAPAPCFPRAARCACACLFCRALLFGRRQSADGVDEMLAAGKDLGEKETEVPDIDSVPRKPRDILCLLLFLVAWGAWLIVAMMAITDGCPDNCNDPRKLVYGFDSQACMCGKDCSQMVPPGPNNKGKYRLYIPDPRDTDLRICVETCPPGFAFNKSSAVSAGTYLCKDNICEEGLTAAQKADNDKMFFQERAYGNGGCPTQRADIQALNCFSLISWPSNAPHSALIFSPPLPLASSDGRVCLCAHTSIMVTPLLCIGAMTSKLDNCFLPTANASDCWYPTYPTSEVRPTLLCHRPSPYVLKRMHACLESKTRQP